jgi:HlyD family secretion protein
MPRRLICLLVGALALPGCAGPRAEAGLGMADGAGQPAEMVVRRGSLRPRLVLTGELIAGRSEDLVVPRTPTWQVQVRWIAEEGTRVAAGERVAELDNTQFVSDLEEKRLAASQAADDLARSEAEAAGTAEEKQFAVQQKQAEVDKARITAAVPEGLLAERERQERQLALERAEIELEKARIDLDSHRAVSAADLAVKRVELEKSRREIAAAEQAIGALVLRAPRAGIVLAAELPWEGRKLREGDSLWVGNPVVKIPDLSSLEIEAGLSDVDDGRVQPGMTATCTLDAFPQQAFRARVAEVAPIAREPDPRSLLRSFRVRLVLDPADPGRPRQMLPGMSVKVEVRQPEQPAARRTLLAPRSGLDLAARPPRAHLADGRAVPVRLGACDSGHCAVLAGLAEGLRLRPAHLAAVGEGG